MRKRTAYIVDDKRVIRESLVKTVRWEEFGFAVVGEAGDGLSAEEGIRRLRPDLIVTDIRMPGRDGLSLAALVQEILPESKVIVITGYDKFEYAQRSLRVGAVDIILKPIGDEAFEAALSRAAEQLDARERSAETALPQAGADDGRAVGHLVKAALVYVEEHFREEIGLASLAETFRVTASHLSRAFKRETGETFLRYLTRRRVEKAEELLADPSLQISEIAYRCGFSDPARFTEVFKEFRGLTPRERRRAGSPPGDKKQG